MRLQAFVTLQTSPISTRRWPTLKLLQRILTCARSRSARVRSAGCRFSGCRRPYKAHRGGLDFRRLFTDRNRIGAQKLACLLLYFDATTDDDGRTIKFEHLRCPPAAAFASRAAACKDALSERSETWLHSQPMEVPAATAFVNFANADFGYGSFIPSCTQEEILQVCCPEMNVGLLILGSVRDDEVVLVHNCRRFAAYEGYAHTFRCTGAVTIGVVQHIICADARTGFHFSPSSVLCDTRKMYTAFAALPRTGTDRPVVSTGRWGCGVFGGMPAHKLLQQVCAAGLAGVDLRFSTFGSSDACDEALNFVHRERLTVSQIWDILGSKSSRAEFAAALQLSVGGDVPSGTQGALSMQSGLWWLGRSRLPNIAAVVVAIICACLGLGWSMR